MKTILSLVLFAVLVSALSGCSSTQTRTAHHESRTISLGEDTYWEGTFQSVTKGEIPASAQPQVIMNPKGTKILAVVYPDPMAGILTAENAQIKVGKQQSNAFGKAVGAINNWIAGWTFVEGLNAATAQRVSDNGLQAAQAAEVTKRAEIAATPTIIDPVAQRAVFPPR